MDGFPNSPEPLRASLARALELKGWLDEATLVRSAEIDVTLDQHDNWNGGIDYYGLRFRVLSGTYIQTPEGKPEFRLGPGSYFMQPGGDYRHTTSCDQASDCVFFVEGKGKFDLKPVDVGKAPPR